MDIISGGESLDNELSHEVTDAEKIAHYETLLARYKGMQPLSASASSRDLDDDLPAPVVHSPVKKLADEDKGVENNPMPLMDEKEPAFIRPILGRESEDEEASLKQNWHSDEAFEARQRAKDLKRRNREAEAQAALQKTVDETEILPQKQLSNHTVEPVNKGLTDEDIKTIHAGHESVSQHVRDLNAALKKLEDSTAFKGLRPSKQKEIQVLVNKIKKGEHKNKGTHHLMALQKDPATHNLHESKARVLEELDADVQALQKVVAKSKNQQLTKALAPVLEAMHGLKTSLTTHNETLGAARSAHEDLDLRYDHQRGETSRDE